MIHTRAIHARFLLGYLLGIRLPVCKKYLSSHRKIERSQNLKAMGCRLVNPRNILLSDAKKMLFWNGSVYHEQKLLQFETEHTLNIQSRLSENNSLELANSDNKCTTHG